MKSRAPLFTPLAAILLLGVPLVAAAHDVDGHAMGFVAGLLHPLSGLDHVLAMAALGTWAALLGGVALWRLPFAFLLGMTLGGAAGLAGVALPGIEAGIAASVVVLGVLLTFDRRGPLFAGGLIGAVVGLMHGYAHGSELPAGTDALGYCVGFIACTALLHASGLMLGWSLRDARVRPMLRSVGAAVAASGLFFTWRALA